jgi:hypothetical protein
MGTDMRDFFIRSFELLVGVIIVIMSIVIVIAAFAAMFGTGMGPMGQGGGILAGLAILVGGAIYIIFIGGIMYLGLGIYQNTKRAAEALDRSRAG